MLAYSEPFLALAVRLFLLTPFYHSRTVMQNLVDTEQLMELLAEEKEIVDQPGATDLIVERGSPKMSIEFDNVRFSCM